MGGSQGGSRSHIWESQRHLFLVAGWQWGFLLRATFLIQ